MRISDWSSDVCSSDLAFSASFELLLIARFIGGTAIAASRVVTVALVRDCYSRRAMARVMSLAFIVFMAAPVLAPTVGQTILLFGSWRLIFAMIGVISAGVLLWFWMWMPERSEENTTELESLLR